MSQKRTYPSGAEKRKKKRTEEEKKERDKGTLLKYFGAQPTPPAPNVSSSVRASTADDTADTRHPEASLSPLRPKRPLDPPYAPVEGNTALPVQPL